MLVDAVVEKILLGENLFRVCGKMSQRADKQRETTGSDICTNCAE